MRRHPLIAMTLALGLAVVSAGCSTPAPAPDSGTAPVLESAQQAPPPPETTTPAGPGYVDRVDPEWAAATAQATGIPLRALTAYAGAAIRAAEVYPDCHVGWNMLAGIGLVESDHGRHAGSSVGDDYRVAPDIYGIQLTSIPDTDGGAVDGDTEFDRAVGPMQLIPQTWASWPSDGNGDAIADPQNIADAAIAGAHHMCRAVAGDMRTADGWRAGIAAYNAGGDYRRSVATAAQRYLDASD